MTWEALTVGRNAGLAWPVAHVLARAGFAVDAVTSSRTLCCSRLLRTVHFVDRPQNLIVTALAAVAARSKPYDWVIVTDDTTLGDIVAYERAGGTVTGLLPLLPDAPRDHIFSKIGLSQALQRIAVQTPPFRVANDAGEMAAAARELGFPVLVKPDTSSGGRGIIELRRDSDQRKRPAGFPVLVQKKIDGQLIDVSAIFLNGVPVHHVHAAVERDISRYGPSALRTYRATRPGPASLYRELTHIGRALGLNGFTNITCIDAADGSGRYYFEIDARPNVWLSVRPFPDEDAATRIRDWFTRLAVTVCDPTAPARTVAHVAAFSRLRLFELLINRYGVWRHIPRGDPLLLCKLIVQRSFIRLQRPLRPIVPRAWRPTLRRFIARHSILVD